MAVEWYVKAADKQVGPLSSSQLKELAERKRITPSTLIRRGDQAQWVQAGTIRDLFTTTSTPPTAAGGQVRSDDPPARTVNPISPPVLWTLAGVGALGGLSLLVFGALRLFGDTANKSVPDVKPAVVDGREPRPTDGEDQKPAKEVVEDRPPAADIRPPEPPPAKPDPNLSAAYRKAVLLNQHGLDELAKAELIDIVMGKGTAAEKAKALYLLGSIAFSEKRIGVALSTWRELVAMYPDAPEALAVRDRITQLAEMAGEGAKESANNAVAESYLRNADFWSNGRDRIFTIDSSWIPHVESAVRWYDKVIAEFPGTTASRIAHEDKLFTILGWKDRRYDTIRFGLEENFDKYMPMLQESLGAFEKEHPNASAIQAFRFQIAQAYWAKNDFANAKIWLEKIIAVAGDGDTFYAHLAKERISRLSRQ